MEVSIWKYAFLWEVLRKKVILFAILKPFIEELENYNSNIEVIWLYDCKIEPCIACKKCQDNLFDFGCYCKDDVQKIFKKILMCDLIVCYSNLFLVLHFSNESTT